MAKYRYIYTRIHGSFAKETCILKQRTGRSHHITLHRTIRVHVSSEQLREHFHKLGLVPLLLVIHVPLLLVIPIWATCVFACACAYA